MRTRLLIDTNIFLEALLQRPRHAEVVQLFSLTARYEFFATHFTVDSVGLYLLRGGQAQLFTEWLNDLIQSGAFQLVALDAAQRLQLVEYAMLYQLDYDDAYQYTAAEVYDLLIVSFDRDFERTPRGRSEPSELISR